MNGRRTSLLRAFNNIQDALTILPRGLQRFPLNTKSHYNSQAYSDRPRSPHRAGGAGRAGVASAFRQAALRAGPLRTGGLEERASRRWRYEPPPPEKTNLRYHRRMRTPGNLTPLTDRITSRCSFRHVTNLGARGPLDRTVGRDRPDRPGVPRRPESEYEECRQ